MGKIKTRYLEVEPSSVTEIGFHQDRSQVSESIFSLGNEYCGVRGFFEEGVSLPSLIGTYYNGIVEYSLEETPSAYKGIVKRTHFTINSTNFLKLSLAIDGEKLDSPKEPFVITQGPHTVKFTIGDYEITKTFDAINGRSYSVNLNIDASVTEEE